MMYKSAAMCLAVMASTPALVAAAESGAIVASAANCKLWHDYAFGNVSFTAGKNGSVYGPCHVDLVTGEPLWNRHRQLPASRPRSMSID